MQISIEDIKIFDKWANKYDKDIQLAEKNNDWFYRGYSMILGTVLSKIKK